MADNVKVEGLAALADAMRALPKELASKSGGPLSKGLRAAANVIRDDARKRAPARTGALRKNIVSKRDRQPSPGANETFEVVVRPVKGKKRGTVEDTFYWRFVEFDTKKMAARPFLRPAFESQKDAAVQQFEKALAAAIDKANRKVSG